MKTVNPERVWLTQAEVAGILGITDRSVRNYIARGVLPASRIRTGRSGRGPVRIRREHVENLLEPVPAVEATA